MRRLLALSVFLASACSPIYVIRAGIEESRILSRRRPIAEVLAHPATDSLTRHKLGLVVQARTFAERILGLAAAESFTTYSWVESDTLLLVLTAAHKDRFEAHTWWFPIVGNVPYKGFFDFERARAEARELEAWGLDTYVRPSAAFSTLGWFDDPVLNTMLRYDDVSLAATVIHEITHNTIYLPGQTAFNESFANFVGERGALFFFCERDGPASTRCAEAGNSWHDTMAYGAFLSDLVQRLESLYARDDLTSAQKIARRETVFDDARARFVDDVQPRLRAGAYAGFARARLNNATLIGTRLYYQQLDLFEKVYHTHDGDLVRAVHAIEEAARRHPDDPFAAVATLLRDADDPDS